MRWEDERYVRVYTRDTVSWLVLTWQARAVYLMILRKVDRAGIIDLGKSGAKGLAGLLSVPAHVVEEALPELLEDGCLEAHGTTIVVPNFIEAQEAKKSDQARQQEHRLKRRDQVRAGLDPSSKSTVVYFIQGEDGGPIKIGRTDDLAKRIVGLETSRPDRLVTLGTFPGTLRDESEIHQRFADIRERGEWFQATPELLAFIKEKTGNAVTVTKRDIKQNVTVTPQTASMAGVTVTPSLAVPSRAEPRSVIAANDAADPPTTSAEITPKARKSKAAKPEASKHPRFNEVVKAYFVAFEEAIGDRPAFSSLDGKRVNELLAKVGDDADRAIAIIQNAYADRFKAKNATITTIALDPSKYLGKATGAAAREPPPELFDAAHRKSVTQRMIDEANRAVENPDAQ